MIAEEGFFLACKSLLLSFSYPVSAGCQTCTYWGGLVEKQQDSAFLDTFVGLPFKNKMW